MIIFIDIYLKPTTQQLAKLLQTLQTTQNPQLKSYEQYTDSYESPKPQTEIGITTQTTTTTEAINNITQLYRDWETDRKSTRLNSSHRSLSRMPSSA